MSAYYVCCIYSYALQNIFTMKKQTLWTLEIWVKQRNSFAVWTGVLHQSADWHSKPYNFLNGIKAFLDQFVKGNSTIDKK